MTEKLLILGASGMVGSACLKYFSNQIGEDAVFGITRSEADLRRHVEVADLFNRYKPKQIIIAAATVGGIQANIDSPKDFMFDNLAIALNVIDCAFKSDVEKLVYLGSACAYPRDVSYPAKEESLLDGRIEPSNEAYGLAKIIGVKLCQSYNIQHGVDFRSVVPTNLYGGADDYVSEKSHVIPALIRKVVQAKYNNEADVEIWGTGKPLREFLHVDDLPPAISSVMDLSSEDFKATVGPHQSHINVGSSDEISIRELAEMIKGIVGYTGELVFNASKPDGVQRKVLDSNKIRSIGWQPTITMQEGLRRAVCDYATKCKR